MQPSEVARAYGSGFTALAARLLRSTDLTLLTGSTVTASALTAGFAGGYLSSFDRPAAAGSKPTSSSGSDVLLVASSVSLYRSSAYPGKALAQIMARKATVLKTMAGEHATHVHLTWFSSLGEKALTLTYKLKTAPSSAGGTAIKTRNVTFLFARGKYVATLNVAGISKPSITRALSLAKSVDARLQHAG